jgi:hypothetical protein
MRPKFVEMLYHKPSVTKAGTRWSSTVVSRFFRSLEAVRVEDEDCPMWKRNVSLDINRQEETIKQKRMAECV